MSARATWLLLMPTLFLLGFLNVTTMLVVCTDEDPRFCSLLDTGGLPVVAFSGFVPFIVGLFGLTMLRDPRMLRRLNWLVFVLAGVLLTVSWVGTTGTAGIVFGLAWLVVAFVAWRTARKPDDGTASASSAGS